MKGEGGRVGVKWFFVEYRVNLVVISFWYLILIFKWISVFFRIVRSGFFEFCRFLELFFDVYLFF